MRRFYPGITLFKLMGALLVLVAHALLIPSMTAMELPPLASFLMLEGRIVVPCFYVVSGFLLYKGWSHAANPAAYVRRYILRITAVYAVFCLLFAFEFNVPALLQGGLGLSNLILQAKILFMAVFVNGPLIQLWFIPPLLFGAAASYWMLSRFKLRSIVVSIAAAYLMIQLVSGSLLGLTGAGTDAERGAEAASVGENVNMVAGGANGEVVGAGEKEGAAGNGTKAGQAAGETNGEVIGAGELELSAASSPLGYAVSWATRYIGFGLTFVAMGALLAKYEERLLRLRVRGIIVGAVSLTLVETALLTSYAPWTDAYKLTFAMLLNTLLLFYGVLRIRSAAMTVHHRLLNLFSIVTFVAHIPFMRLNAWMFGWAGSMELTLWQQALQTLLTFAECAALTVILYRRRGAAKPVAGATVVSGAEVAPGLSHVATFRSDPPSSAVTKV